jgi:pimeloyl-ACP methyl ester carboxylesterase
MAAPMLPIQSRCVLVDGLRVHCLTAGNSPKRLLLLHGGSSDSARLCWSDTIAELSAHYQVLAPDLPGFGDSDQPPVSYSLDFFTEFAAKLSAAIGWERYCLAGYSMGGWIALRLAVTGPGRVDKLILVDSAGLGTYVPWRYLAWGLTKTPWLHESLRKHYVRSRRLVRFGVSQLVANRKAITPQLIDEILPELRRPRAGRAWASFLRNELGPHGFRRHSREDLARIGIPCLIIHGEKDPLIPVEAARTAHRLMPDSRLFVLPGCGHWPQKEEPEEFLRILKEFLL